MDEVRQLTPKNMDETMAEIEENSIEARQVNHRKMDDMVGKAEYMACDMRRTTRYMKAEMKKVKAEAYERLVTEKEKLKYECHPKKIQTSIAKRSKGASIYMRMFPCLDWQE